MGQKQKRERRFMHRHAGPWHEKLCAQKRTRAALRKNRVLIQLRVLLIERLRDIATAYVADAFRRNGFIVRSDERVGLLVTGEPCLALTFMDMAATGGLLKGEFQVQLNDILADADWLRAKNRPHALGTLDEVLPLLHSIEPPNSPLEGLGVG